MGISLSHDCRLMAQDPYKRSAPACAFRLAPVWRWCSVGPSLFGEWNRYKNPTHHVSRLEIPLWAFGMHIVTIGAPLRQGFIGIECLKDASPALGHNPCIGTIGIHEDLRKRSPLELCRWAILFVYRPTADQPVSNPISLFSHEPPRFE